MTNNGIISKDRVKQHGEVFTPDSIVNNMLDMVDEQYKDLDNEGYISKTYLEPSCGDGQFLVRILYRKLERVSHLSKDIQPLYLIKALTSIYGIDIQPDNIKEARERLKRIVQGLTDETFDLNNQKIEIKVQLDIEYTEQLNNIIEMILKNNIVCGNALTGKLMNKDNETDFPLVFKAYHFNNDRVSITDFKIKDIEMEENQTPEVYYMDIAKLLETKTTEELQAENVVENTDELDF